jgi:hypothetical protein
MRGEETAMTQKAIGWTLVALLALLLGATMLGQMFLFNWGDRNFTGDMERAMKQAGTGDWAGAEQAADRAVQLWNQGNFLVAVKYAESDYTLLNLTLTRFRAAILKRNAYDAEKEGLSCLFLFKNITSIAPQP